MILKIEIVYTTVMIFSAFSVNALDLINAAENGDKKTVLLLLQNGALQNNISAVINQRNKCQININGCTALIAAAISGNTDIAEILLQYNPSINAKDNSGRTALMHAAREGRNEIIGKSKH